MDIYLREIAESESTYLTTLDSISDFKVLIHDIRERDCYLVDDQINAVFDDWQYCIENGQAYVEILLERTQ